ncbi:hypothetical protein [Rhodohalobacter mucosus]|uniref:hypothetical protein n=1 Tax=Rhodohalobacter mucosus TaxID=2079485 RepID=UPI001FA8F7F7|nr:hypothetical protein [Rhodohalobacter mucosus]
MKKTALQIIEFGNLPEDQFYCLINLNISPDGMNIEKLRLTDPRNFDLQFRESGCLLMLTEDEIEELIRRKEIDRDSIHESLYKLARQEGVI